MILTLGTTGCLLSCRSYRAVPTPFLISIVLYQNKDTHSNNSYRLSINMCTYVMKTFAAIEKAHSKKEVKLFIQNLLCLKVNYLYSSINNWSINILLFYCLPINIFCFIWLQDVWFWSDVLIPSILILINTFCLCL